MDQSGQKKVDLEGIFYVKIGRPLRPLHIEIVKVDQKKVDRVDKVDNEKYNFL